MNGLNADSPPIRRGSALALGAMPSDLLRPSAHKVLTSLAAATQVLIQSLLPRISASRRFISTSNQLVTLHSSKFANAMQMRVFIPACLWLLLIVKSFQQAMIEYGKVVKGTRHILRCTHFCVFMSALRENACKRPPCNRWKSTQSDEMQRVEQQQCKPLLMFPAGSMALKMGEAFQERLKGSALNLKSFSLFEEMALPLNLNLAWPSHSVILVMPQRLYRAEALSRHVLCVGMKLGAKTSQTILQMSLLRGSLTASYKAAL